MNRRIATYVLVFVFTSLIVVATALSLVQSDISPDLLKPKFTATDAHFLKLKELDVHYLDSGVGNHTVILLHGLGGFADVWSDWVQLLRGGYRVIAVTLPGFGLTGPFGLKHYGLDIYVEFLKAFVGALNIPSFTLVGHDFGGLIAAKFASLSYPQVRQLVLLAPFGIPGSARTPILYMEKIPVLNVALTQITPRMAIKALLNLAYVPQHALVTDELISDYYALNHRRGNREALLSILHMINNESNVALSKITIPTLVLWGEADRVIPAQTGKNFVGTIPRSKLLMYKGIGHMIMNAIPRQSASDTANFIVNPGRTGANE